MAVTYRVKVFTGGDGSPTNHPCGHRHTTKAGADSCLKKNQAAGHAGAIQMRLYSTEPWHWLDELKTIPTYTMPPIPKNLPKEKTAFDKAYERAYQAAGPIEPDYTPRHITNTQLTELINLYHLAKIAVAGTENTGKHAQMIWAANEFHKLHPSISSNAAYKDLSNSLA